MIVTIARKELLSMFATPMGWLILAIFQAIIGTYYSLSFNQYFDIMQSAHWQVQRIGLTQFMAEGIFGVATVLMLFVVPLVTMKLISEERRQQTLVLLTSAPLSIAEIVVGKLAAAQAYLSLLVIVMVAMIAMLLPWAEIDLPYLLTYALGLWLLVLASGALGLYCSSLTAHPVLAAFCSMVALGGWWLLDKFFSDDRHALFHALSLMQHYRPFAQGMLNSGDVAFLLLFALCFTLLTIRRLHRERHHD
ncbi:MAG TPA: ABC transporter permease subunit [Methylophilus sp.]